MKPTTPTAEFVKKNHLHHNVVFHFSTEKLNTNRKSSN